MDNRKVDALLEKRLFGKCIHERQEWREWEDYMCMAASRSSGRMVCLDCGENDPEVGYYGTWAGMGSVVERMRELGWEFTLQLFGDGIAWVKFNKPDGRGYDYEEANTAPMAVALAALRTMGVNLEDLNRE
jgi:hypothetical protein